MGIDKQIVEAYCTYICHSNGWCSFPRSSCDAYQIYARNAVAQGVGVQQTKVGGVMEAGNLDVV